MPALGQVISHQVLINVNPGWIEKDCIGMLVHGEVKLKLNSTLLKDQR